MASDVKRLNEQLARKTDELVRLEAKYVAATDSVTAAQAALASAQAENVALTTKVDDLAACLEELYDLAAYAVSPRNAARNAQIQEARRRAIALLNS